MAMMVGTEPMVKTNVLIPEPLFEASEHLARRFGMSQSDLHIIALSTFIQMYRQQDVTELLNRVYETESSALDAPLMQAQILSVGGETW